MNIAITEGIALTPPPFAEGLDVWSSEDGTPGSATYDGAGNAAFVPADPAFGGCLELLKTQSTQKLRWTGQTPIYPGIYLRVRTRIKAVSGVFPTVRIAGFAADADGDNLAAVPQSGPATTLDTYGEVVEISAIVGVGDRSGVDMVWGPDASYGHFGLDLTGGSGGIVRIEDFVIEDITSAFLRDMMATVDVRDYGAVGDGVTDDKAAFEAADEAAAGLTLVVPEGRYYIGSSMTITAKVRFDGTVTMNDADTLTLIRNFDLPTYIDAFGDEVLGFRKGFQALMGYADHDAFDMAGRRIDLDGPIDMAAAAGIDSFAVPRTIRNGLFYVQDSTGWESDEVVTSGRYNPNNPYQLTALGNAPGIAPGSLVTGNGVGREVYVTEVNVAAGSLTLSQPLYGAATTQNYTFTRFKYALDFSGFEKLQRFTLQNVEFRLNRRASGVILARNGANFHVKDCYFNKPKDRGITSPGEGCSDLHIDRCQFASSEDGVPAADRTSVAFNVNGNDSKIRDSRFQRFGLTGILNGSNNLIVGNHWFQGDDLDGAPRMPGMVFTYEPCESIVTGNYIDNAYIEWTNEHDAHPDHGSEYTFGGLTITGNIFLVSDAVPSYEFIVVKPYGEGHSISGLHVNQNVFRSSRGTIDSVAGIDTSIADLNRWNFRNITFERNTFHGVANPTSSPVPLRFTQNSTLKTWTLDAGGYLPFDGAARTVTAVVKSSRIENASGQLVKAEPYVNVGQGPNGDYVQLVWPEPCSGSVVVTVRTDRPL